jgi:hypothetical protein
MSSEDDPTGQNEGGQAGQDGQTGGQTGGQTAGQTGGQPGQVGGQAGGQPGQAQPGQGRPQQVQTGPSATDVLSQPAGQSVVKYVVGIFAAVGVGIGLTGVLANSLLGGGGTSAASFVSFGITLMAFGVAIFGGSILAAVIGLQDFLQIGEVDNQTYVLAFVSNAAGFIVMGVIVALFITILGGSGGGTGGSGGGGLGDFIVGSIVMAIPAGIVGAGVTWLRDWQPGVAKN